MPYYDDPRAQQIAETIQINPQIGARMLHDEIYQRASYGMGEVNELVSNVQRDMRLFEGGYNPNAPQLHLEGINRGGCATGGADLFIQYNAETQYGVQPQFVHVADLQVGQPGYGGGGGTAVDVNVHFGRTNINVLSETPGYGGGGGYGCNNGELSLGGSYGAGGGYAPLGIVGLQLDIGGGRYGQYGNWNTQAYQSYSPIWQQQQINQYHWQPGAVALPPQQLTQIQQTNIRNTYTTNVTNVRNTTTINNTTINETTINRGQPQPHPITPLPRVPAQGTAAIPQGRVYESTHQPAAAQPYNGATFQNAHPFVQPQVIQRPAAQNTTPRETTISQSNQQSAQAIADQQRRAQAERAQLEHEAQVRNQKQPSPGKTPNYPH